MLLLRFFDSLPTRLWLTGSLGKARRDITPACLALWCLGFATVLAQSPRLDQSSEELSDAFEKRIGPWIGTHCAGCHNEDNRESGVRVDHLDASLPEESLRLWESIRDQVHDGKMPPEEEPQPTAEERLEFLRWLDQSLHLAKTRPTPRNGTMRRLTVPQYDRSLRSLLGIDRQLTTTLPPDAVSRDGFTNQASTLVMNPLQLEAYFKIAEQALETALVDPKRPPTIQFFRMDLGKSIHPNPSSEPLVLGANNHLLPNADFIVTEPDLTKPFPFELFRMQRKFRFIEGYQGNDTVRAWRDFDGIEHSVFACMRGNEGYPKGRAYEIFPNGLALRPAIPSPEIFGESSTYGPQANFKISLRELPENGKFQVRVTASRIEDLLLIDPSIPIWTPEAPAAASAEAPAENNSANPSAMRVVSIPEDGVYQIQITTVQPKDSPAKEHELKLELTRPSSEPNQAPKHLQACGMLKQPAFAVARMQKGDWQIALTYGGPDPIDRVEFHRLDKTRPNDDSSDEPAASTKATRWFEHFERFETRSPKLGVHIGLRRDCGSTLSQVGASQLVASKVPDVYIFEGDIANFPTPDVEANNVNYLAGIREIGVRHEYTDGRETPRLLIHRVEFEGPFYDTWPPESHRRIFSDPTDPTDRTDRTDRTDPTDPKYARGIVERFATNAFRRPLSSIEKSQLEAILETELRSGRSLAKSIQETLLVVLTSPQFLYITETSQGPQAEPLDEWELASKLSYFLWNAPPDTELLGLAREGQLRTGLDYQIDRLLADRRSESFADSFVSEWLSLDKFDVVEIDAKRYPHLTRDARKHLRREPIEFFRHMLKTNAPAIDLIQSDYLVANEVVASYYGLGDQTESGFEFTPLVHRRPSLGGVLTQAAPLAGLSDGREANPVKRGAWFARRIIAEPPEDPPPNVPKLEDLTELTLREKLQRHRDVRGCAQCHSGIDPWGLPFEQYDASGRGRADRIDSATKLANGRELEDFHAFRTYLAQERVDQVAFSFAKHLAIYACGRGLTYNETLWLRENLGQHKESGYRTVDILRWIIHSDLFDKK